MLRTHTHNNNNNNNNTHKYTYLNYVFVYLSLSTGACCILTCADDGPSVRVGFKVKKLYCNGEELVLEEKWRWCRDCVRYQQSCSNRGSFVWTDKYGFGGTPEGKVFSGLISPEGGELAWLHNHGKCVFVLVFSFVLSQLITCGQTWRSDHNDLRGITYRQGYREKEAPDSFYGKMQKKTFHAWQD